MTATASLTPEVLARRELAHAQALIALGDAEPTGRLASILAADVAYLLERASHLREQD
ncbi:hypothetical protein DVA67_020380 [Solirubrobacter sp. CPCC 204708]|nr:hypothetical protein [Solirubrobacter deserti]